jgi:hypothetical protein
LQRYNFFLLITIKTKQKCITDERGNEAKYENENRAFLEKTLEDLKVKPDAKVEIYRNGRNGKIRIKRTPAPKHERYETNVIKITEYLYNVLCGMGKEEKTHKNSRVFHNIESDYLQNYLNEFCYKFNRRYFGEAQFERVLIASVNYKNQFRYYIR